MIKKCETCGKEFKINPYNIKRGWGKFCSRACKDISQIGEDNCKCIICGKKFHKSLALLKRNAGRFCSKKCYGVGNSGKNNTMWKDKKIKKTCLVCNKKYNTYNHYSEFCSRKCKGVVQRLIFKGNNHPNWLGGKSFETYPKEFNYYLREKIRERDGYKCQVCGTPQIECYKSLQVHHIDYDKKNCSINNLISLCNKCHAKTTRGDRINWTETLKEKICQS